MSDANFELMGRSSSSNSGPANSDAILAPTAPASGSNSGPAVFFRAFDQAGGAYAGLVKDYALKILRAGPNAGLDRNALCSKRYSTKMVAVQGRVGLSFPRNSCICTSQAIAEPGLRKPDPISGSLKETVHLPNMCFYLR